MSPIGSINLNSFLGSGENLPGAGGAGGAGGISGIGGAGGSDDLSGLTQSLSGALPTTQGAAAGAATAAGAVSGAVSGAAAAAAAQAQGPSFGSYLQNAIGEVNQQLEAADTAKNAVLSGETNNVHQSMIAVQEANVAFSLMVEVRNKLVDSYQELMRMQV